MAKITDEQYFNLADRVYNNDVLESKKPIGLKDGSQWRVISYVDKKGSGLQAIAVVPAKDYQKGKTDYDNVVFVSRGSEPNKSQFVKDWVNTDFLKLGMGFKPATDAKAKMYQGENLKKISDLSSKTPIPGMKLFQLPSWYVNTDNQFSEYHLFVNQTIQKFNIRDYSFTGHSLGGALAQYMGVKTKKKAVTYAAANPYRLLSKAEQAEVNQGDFNGLIIDYRHRLDPVGKIVPNGETIGQQFIMDTNPNAKLGTFVFMGHMRGTFSDMFHTNGTAKLKIEPNAVIQQANRIDNVVAVMRKVQQRMEDLEEVARQESRQLRQRLEEDTIEGARFSELTSWDVDNALTEESVHYRNGVYEFHDADKFEEFYASNEKNIKKLLAFQHELIQAAKTMREKDNTLGSWIAANMT
ncbi:lipase [Listeria sp. ILCC792]|uniref:lipase n=1 Tax=Listeria sp. ILCC792 TaxID=1918331 RepID=UPI000B589B7F|nr:lipase [Listeria sp. ILCC792]